MGCKNPERMHVADIIMEFGGTRGWAEVICPECDWHSDFMIRTSSLSPDYLFKCERPDQTCSARWSIVQKTRQ